MRDLWIILELLSDGETLDLVPTMVTSWNEAQVTFYQKLIAALEGNVLEHTILIMDKLGQVVKKELVTHPAEPKEEDSEGEDPEIIK